MGCVFSGRRLCGAAGQSDGRAEGARAPGVHVCAVVLHVHGAVRRGVERPGQGSGDRGSFFLIFFFVVSNPTFFFSVVSSLFARRIFLIHPSNLVLLLTCRMCRTRRVLDLLLVVFSFCPLYLSCSSSIFLPVVSFVDKPLVLELVF